MLKALPTTVYQGRKLTTIALHSGRVHFLKQTSFVFCGLSHHHAYIRAANLLRLFVHPDTLLAPQKQTCLRKTRSSVFLFSAALPRVLLQHRLRLHGHSMGGRMLVLGHRGARPRPPRGGRGLQLRLRWRRGEQINHARMNVFKHGGSVEVYRQRCSTRQRRQTRRRICPHHPTAPLFMAASFQVRV